MDQKQLLLQLLGTKPVSFNPEIARLVGSVKAGLFLCQLLYWMDKGKDPEWFYKTIDEIEQETALSREEQDGAIKKLKELGLIETQVKGMPPKRHFKVNLSNLHKLICVKSTNRIVENPQTNTENTTEITTTLSNDKEAEPIMGEIRENDLPKGGVILQSSRIRGKPQVYGNPDINEFLAYFKSKLKLSVLDGTIGANRQYTNLLFKKFGGLEKCKLLIDSAANNSFWASKVTSVQKLYYKGVEISKSLEKTEKRFEMEEGGDKYAKFK